MSNDKYPLFAVPEAGLPRFDGVEFGLAELEKEVEHLLWPVADRFGELELHVWMVEGVLEKGSLRTVIRAGAAELNRVGMLADGTNPVILRGDTATCYVPEDCVELWRETVVWHAVFATTHALCHNSDAVVGRLQERARGCLVKTWEILAEKLGVDAPSFDWLRVE